MDNCKLKRSIKFLEKKLKKYRTKADDNKHTENVKYYDGVSDGIGMCIFEMKKFNKEKKNSHEGTINFIPNS